MRVIGLDVSRTVAEIAYLRDGRVRPGGRIALDQGSLVRFAAELSADDHVVLEATGNTAAIVAVLQPHVDRVVIANPLKVRLIAEAHVKTDKIDAAILAQLYASGFLPEVWIPDERTQALAATGRSPCTGRAPAHPFEERDPFGARGALDPALYGHRSLWQAWSRLVGRTAIADG